MTIAELAGLRDNEKWLGRLRGNDSKKVAGESTSRSIQLLDFDNLENNAFVVTRQFYVKGPTRVIEADLVVFVNGIPLVVIEAKDLGKSDAEGIAQVRRYEADVEVLFYSNLFNVVTSGASFRYGATNAPAGFPIPSTPGPSRSSASCSPRTARGARSRRLFLNLMSRTSASCPRASESGKPLRMGSRSRIARIGSCSSMNATAPRRRFLGRTCGRRSPTPCSLALRARR